MAEYTLTYNRITGKLASARRKETFLLLFGKLLNSISVTLILILLGTILESAAHGDIAFRGFVALSIVIGCITSLSLFMPQIFLRAIGLKYLPTLEEMALRVGKNYPELSDKLCNVIQLISKVSNSRGTSKELSIAAFESVSGKANSLDFDKVIEKNEFKRSVIIFLSIVIISFLSFGAFSSSLGESLYRIANWNRSFIPPAPFTIDIFPKNQGVLRGESVKVTVKAWGIPPGSVNLFVKEEQQENYDSYTIKADSAGFYHYEISSLKHNLLFYAEANWLNSKIITVTGKIRVIEKPLIRSITGKVTFPSYTGTQPILFNEQSGDISALRGSNVDLTILANKDLNKANIVFIPDSKHHESLDSVAKNADTVRYKLNVSGNSANGNFKIMRSGSYFIQITDRDGETNQDPITYNIIALSDNYPSISLVDPLTDITVNENALLPIKVSISDDYGFSGLKLHYKLLESRYTPPDSKYSTININVLTKELAAEIPYLWDLHKLSIAPEDKYEFYLEIFDNDVVTGPKSARTQSLTVRLPSLEEVLQSADDVQKKVENDLSKVLNDANEVKKEMEDLNREMLKKPNDKQLDWKEKKKAEDIMKKQAELKDKVADIQKSLEQMTQNLQENKMLSPETMEKYQELQKLLQEVNSPELKQIQQRIDNALKNVDQAELQKAMKQVEFNEEQFRKSIDRTMKLLKRIKAEQKADALAKLSEELSKMQQDLEKQAENANPNDQGKQKELAEKQKNLQEDAEKMNKELGELEQLMKEIGKDMPMDELDKAKESLDMQDTRQQMQDAQKNMKKGDLNKAKQNQNKAAQNLQNFSQQMQNLRKQMQDKNSKEVMKKMQKAVSNMLDLSKQQESLKDKSQTADYNSTQIPDYADSQENTFEGLANVANSLMELSEKSFAITPEMGLQIGNALKGMREAIKELSDRNMSQATKSQASAMGSLNSAISQMQDMMSAMQNQGSGSCQNPGGTGQGQSGSGQSFSERLQQLAAQQQGINMAMQQQMGQQGGKLSPQQQAEIGRLADKQGSAQKSLQELNNDQKKYTGGDKKNLGDLEKIAKDMKEVVADMQSGNIKPETLQRQEKILSRLLDATKSMNDRDYEKKRESKSGKEYNQNSPGAIDFSTQEGRAHAIQEMLKSVQQGYTKDYENLIRRYFESLQKGNKMN